MEEKMSVYTTKLNDKQAIYLTREEFPIKGDGIHDDTEMIQDAINTIQKKHRFGIVFIPEGKYCITKTIYVWKGIRLIGYGVNRPIFFLNENTPGFTNQKQYMIHFVSDKQDDGKIRDANPGTFYSAISNIDFEVMEGNCQAICIRSFFAQHSYLSHLNFNLKSGLASVEAVGNEIENCHFTGGDYGIVTTKPSPSWPFLMTNSSFSKQKIASIKTEEAGLTLLNNVFNDVPIAIMMNENRSEALFMKNTILKNIKSHALIISNENNARTQMNYPKIYLITGKLNFMRIYLR